MDAHHRGAVPGLAASELAHEDAAGLPPLGAGATHLLVTPTSYNAHLAVGAVERQGATDPLIFEQLTGGGKRFATLRAQLALKGFGLSRTHVADGPVRFYVTRWGLVRELRDFAAVCDFADQVGVKS